jgi:hypothetical protein
MLWVALASLIMAFSGSGDDTRLMRELVASLHKAVAAVVHDPERVASADTGIDDLARAFAAHRDGLAENGACIEKLDRSYEVTVAQYELCDQGIDARWQLTIDAMVSAERQVRTSLHDDEWPALRKAFAGDKP